MAIDPSNSRQRAASAVERGLLILLLVLIAVMAAIWAARWGWWLDPPLAVRTQPQADYLNKLDPNTADPESLARVPTIGPMRAKAIVDYRKAHTGPGPAFRSPADLARVKGIGPETAARMAPLLAFPQPATTTPDPP